jgi:hypothetical protein
MNFFLKHLAGSLVSKLVVFISNAGNIFIFLTCCIVNGQVFGADVKPELCHVGSERVDANLKDFLNFSGGLCLTEFDFVQFRSESRLEIACGLFMGGNLKECERVIKIGAGNFKSEAIGNERTKQGTGNSKPASDQGNFISGKLHDWIIILFGGFGGIAIGLAIVWWFLSSNVQIEGLADYKT